MQPLLTAKHTRADEDCQYHVSGKQKSQYLILTERKQSKSSRPNLNNTVTVLLNTHVKMTLYAEYTHYTAIMWTEHYDVLTL